jgi:hypothetical protein
VTYLCEPQRTIAILRSPWHHVQKKSAGGRVQARRRWIREQGWLDTARLVFIDETAVTTNLMTVPGIGPIVSSAMVAAIGTGDVFSKGRDFGAWLGLVPKQISTGDRTILGGISRRGNRYLRALFVQAAWVGWSGQRNGSAMGSNLGLKRRRSDCTTMCWPLRWPTSSPASRGRFSTGPRRPMRWRPVQMRRAQGPSRLAVALALPLASVPPGHALTAPEHGARPGMPLKTRVPWINPIPENSLKPNQPLIPRFEARKSRSGRAGPDATEEGWLHRLSLRQYCAAIISQFQA